MRRAQIAFQTGYRVDKNGVAYGVRGGDLVCTLDKHGYARFGFRRTSVYVHRLQAYQKFGDALYEDHICVRHLNSDPLDNSWDNIAIGTLSDNKMDQPAGVRHALAVRAGRNNSFLTEGDVREIRYLREIEGWSYKELIAEFGAAKSTISYIVCGKTWRDT